MSKLKTREEYNAEFYAEMHTTATTARRAAEATRREDALAAPPSGIACPRCGTEMHKLGGYFNGVTIPDGTPFRHVFVVCPECLNQTSIPVKILGDEAHDDE